MKKFVYIASLPHSGSTLLDLMLGGHSRCIGLGEVARFLERDLENSRQAICSCGKTMETCDFWSQVASRLQAGPKNLDLAAKYLLVFDVFEKIFGEEYLLIDSSKHLPPLEILHGILPDKLAVLFLMKDVRSATISRIDNRRRKGTLPRRPRLEGFSGYLFWQWYRRNQKMQRFFRERNLPVLQMGYEEVCLYPDLMMQKVCEFLEIEMKPAMCSLQQSGSHVMRGNRMRYQKEKSEIRYDHRWFLRREWLWPAICFPNIMRYNAKEVYQNDTEAIWKR